jgi:hypothetical protein
VYLSNAKEKTDTHIASTAKRTEHLLSIECYPAVAHLVSSNTNECVPFVESEFMTNPKNVKMFELVRKTSPRDDLLMRLMKTRFLDIQLIALLHMYLKHEKPVSTALVKTFQNTTLPLEVRQAALAHSLAKWNMGVIVQSSTLPFAMRWTCVQMLYEDTVCARFPAVYLRKKQKWKFVKPYGK